MDGADWLRTQLTSFGCASCGRAFASSGIRILAERDGLFFVDLGCASCGSQAVAVVTVRIEDGAEPAADVGELEPASLPALEGREPTPPVDAEDLLDMHAFLSGFDGDFRRLFRDVDGS